MRGVRWHYSCAKGFRDKYHYREDMARIPAVVLLKQTNEDYAIGVITYILTRLRQNFASV